MQLGNPRILYIEDHDDTREMITLVLNQKGFQVVTGSTVARGIELSESAEFDLYLLDSWLPDGSGLELCRKIRDFNQNTPILFYSAAAYDADRNLALESGAQAYLIKPTPTSELCDLVSSLIEQFHKKYRVAAY